MSNDKNQNKDNNKERLQKQAEHRIAERVEGERLKEGYTDKMDVDPSKKIVQTDDSKVQNPMRNLAKGGNNTELKQKSGGS